MIVVGTAGHIDHGKTALVRALTGVDTDRLPVEKARGITTELGFAHLDLDGRRVAVIDVPGHERFVRAMVAGATGVDLACLVIAADEGIMPQTREHLAICDLLGLARGVVALTKRDLVDDELLALATTEVRAALAGTFLDGAPIVPVSARTGAGLDELRAALAAGARALTPRDPHAVFRLPIDRVFTRKGFGTVVTGTVLGGEVALGDELRVLPSGRATRVRGLEVHGVAEPRARAGQRAALNLHGLAVGELARGELLCHPERVAASHLLDVELRALPGAPALGARTKVLLHHGAAQVAATVALVERATLEPGATGLAQLRLAAPVGALPGDRFIVRGFVTRAAHGATLGGGRVLRVLAPRARRAAHARTVAELAAAPLPARLALDVRAAAHAGLSLAELVQRHGRTDLAAPLDALVAAGTLLRAGDRYVHADAVEALEAHLLALPPMPRESLRTQLPAAVPPRVFDAIVDRIAHRLPTPPAPADPAPLELLATLARCGLETPPPATLDPAALGRLLAAKLVTRIKPDYVVATAALDELRARLVAFLDAHGSIDTPRWKALTGASRKYAIPLAEHFDAEKLTLRVGAIRRRR